MEKVKFHLFIKELLLNPKSFFQKHFTSENTEPPYFIFMILIYGIGKAIDSLQHQFSKYDAKGNLDRLNALNQWWSHWLFVIIIGAITGYLSYLIGGWFFNLRVKWSKGDANIFQSRNIFLYSRSIYSLSIISTTIIDTFISPKPYISNSDFTAWDLASLVIIVTFLYHSAYIGYTGVITLTNADKKRSKFWFLILPMILFLTALIALIVILTKYIY